MAVTLRLDDMLEQRAFLDCFLNEVTKSVAESVASELKPEGLPIHMMRLLEQKIIDEVAKKLLPDVLKVIDVEKLINVVLLAAGKAQLKEMTT